MQPRGDHLSAQNLDTLPSARFGAQECDDGQASGAAVREIITNFDKNLERAKPHLFNLAGMLIEGYEDRQWGVLVGDETGGRLVTRFVRLSMESAGIRIPTAYICASKSARHQVAAPQYESYIDHIADNLARGQNALVITESVGSGSTLFFLEEHMSRRFSKVDFGIGIARYAEVLREIQGIVYLGGVGIRAQKAIFNAFEQPLPPTPVNRVINFISSIMPSTVHQSLKGYARSYSAPSHSLTNLSAPRVTDGTESLPLARLADDPTFRISAAHCYRQISRLAQEFTLTRGKDMH